MAGTFYGDDQLRDDWQNLIASFFQQIVSPQNGKGTVWVEFFSRSIEENGKIVVIVQTLN